MIITKENSPHIRGKASVTRMMADVLIALAPTLIFAFVVYPAQAAINRIGKYTDQVFVTTVDSDNKQGYQSMNGNITFYCEKGSEYTVTGSNNSTILKDTEWFKSNRTWPTT